MKKAKRPVLLILTMLLSSVLIGAQQRSPAGVAAQSRAITIVTEPNASVWIDDVLRGKTDEAGKLTIKNAPPGARRLRVRANGFKETAQAVTAAQKGDVRIALVKTTDLSAGGSADGQTKSRRALPPRH